MSPDPDPIASYAARVRDAVGHKGPIGAFAFGDSPAMADELADLVLHGDKRATAGWANDPGDDEPREGDVWIVKDGGGAPVCAIRTVEVTTAPFSTVTPAFAWDEGEDDRTLESWRESHDGYFRRRSVTVGIPFSDDEPIRFERFDVVFPEVEPPPPLVQRDAVAVRPMRRSERGWIRALLGPRAEADDLLAATGGFPADACPALDARADLRSAGLLVFRPTRARTTVVSLTVLDDSRAVDTALLEALEVLCERYGWGPIE